MLSSSLRATASGRYLQAPFRSGVSIEDYQLDPLVRAIDMSRTNLLIADDVGLGKTIEAGLVVQEMLLRHRARTVLVLCPASLQEKWRVEMQEKFGLEFRIVDTDYVKRLRRERGLHANPWTSFPRLITSMDWAKQGEGLRLLRDALPPHVSHPRKFDLLIIDEAHNVAPTVGRYAVESLRTRLVRLAAPHFQHKLFLTATPHDGYKESFTALLELLDDQRFSRTVDPSDPQLARVMVRRLKSDLVDAHGKRIYPERRLEALRIEYGDDEKDARRLLDAYIESRESGADGGRPVDHFVHQLLRKRLSSSPAAFAATLERHIATIEGRTSSERSRKKFDDRNPSESPVRILLATDAASEGIDLQNHCHLMIHLEIPYNPNVMEQRNGRVDRHGQRADEVVIWHPVDAEGGHGDDILRALRKLDAMRADMGSVNPVIAPQLPDLLEGRRRDLDMRPAEARMERSRRFVKVERDVRDRVAKLHERLNETRSEQGLTPDHIERAVRTALKLADKPDLEPISLPGAPDGATFRMPPLSGSWSRCLEGLEHPYTQKVRPITFDHEVAKGRDDIVLVHLNHRLVQMSLRLLRAEIWARDDVKKLHRVAVRSLPDGQIEGPAVVVTSRLVVTGGNHHRLHEELTEAGGYLRDGGFRREERVTEIRRWLEDSRPAALSDSTFDALRTRFDKQRDAVLAAVEARSKDRLRFLTNTIETRKDKEADDIRQILDDLERALQTEISADRQPIHGDAARARRVRVEAPAGRGRRPQNAGRSQEQILAALSAGLPPACRPLAGRSTTWILSKRWGSSSRRLSERPSCLGSSTSPTRRFGRQFKHIEVAGRRSTIRT